MLLKLMCFLTPYDSIRRCLWFIAGCIADRSEVFIIAIWCGETKYPLNLDAYLEDFINEILEIRNGFNICCVAIHITRHLRNVSLRARLITRATDWSA